MIDPDYTMTDRRYVREQEHRIIETMTGIVSMWRPVIQFHAAIWRACAEGFEAIAVNLDRFDGNGNSAGTGPPRSGGAPTPSQRS